MNHVSVSPTDGNGPTQGQRKTLTRVGIEPTTFGLDLRRSTDWATRSDGSRPWELKMRFCELSMTFNLLLTDVKKSYWFSWTCRLRLTPLTMKHFLQDFTLDMESVEQPSHGLDPILLTVINKLSFMAILLVRCLFNLVSLKGLFWDLCCLPCFLLPSKTSF